MSNEFFSQLINDIKSKIVRSHITNFLVINSSTFIFVSSYLRDEKIILSLDSIKPYIGFIKIKELPLTINNGLSSMARHYIKDAYVVDVEQINNDNIIRFTFRQNDKNVYKDYYLYVELINKNPNFIITDTTNRILLATRYINQEDKRKILINETYSFLDNSNTHDLDISYSDYLKRANKIYESSLKKRLKEKYNNLFVFINGKIKTLSKKENILNEEIASGNNMLILKEYGDCCLYMEEEEIYSLLNENKIHYDETLSLKQLSLYFYKQYKRGKAKIEHAKEQLKICKEELNYYTYLKDSVSTYSEEELDSLMFDLIKVKKENRKTDKIKNAKNPYYLKINGTEILFGKNREQNQNLTFHIANKKNTFLHIHNYPGSHIIIKNENPTNEQLLLASELALTLSNKVAGEVMVAKISDVKSTTTTGLVQVNKYRLIKINNISNNIKNLLKEAKKI